MYFFRKSKNINNVAFFFFFNFFMCSNIIYVKESFVRLVIPCFSKKDWSCQDEILSIHNPTNDRFCPKKKPITIFYICGFQITQLVKYLIVSVI